MCLTHNSEFTYREHHKHCLLYYSSINTEHWTGCASLTAQPSGMEQEDCFDFLFKIILIGDTDVGKTSVIQRFKTGNFSERQQSTIGVDFIVRTLNIQGRKIKVSLINLRCSCFNGTIFLVFNFKVLSKREQRQLRNLFCKVSYLSLYTVGASIQDKVIFRP